MKRQISFFVLGFLFLGCPKGSSPQAVLKTFTLEELVPLRTEFYPEKLAGDWISDTEFVHLRRGYGLLKLDAERMAEDILLPEPATLNLTGYSIVSYSKDLNYFLLSTNEKKVYRYSSLAEYSVYDKRSLSRLGNGPLQVVVWGSGRSLAYVQDNNVFYVPDVAQPQEVRTLTSDGVPGDVYYGAADWIYEEEILNAAEALWFSPDGMSLAVAFFNDTQVESASYPIYGNPFDVKNQYPETISFKYPKAGRTNPTVGLKVFKLGAGRIEARTIPAPVDVVGLDHILGRVAWASDRSLVVLWLNRRQNISILVNCDLNQDKCNLLQQQTEPSGWIDINQPIFPHNGTKMLDIQNADSGDRIFPHAIALDFNTLATQDVSPGNLTVTDILGWYKESDSVYFIVAPYDVPWQRQLWASRGGAARCVSCSEPSCHTVNAQFSPGAAFGIVTCSETNRPPKLFLYSAKDDSFKILEDNVKLAKKFSEYNLPMSLFNTINLGGDVKANIQLMLPPEMKEGQQYPMVVRVYAGPGTTKVLDHFDLEYYSLYLAANRSFIVASIDVRGSKVMGTEALFAVNNALGTVEVTDTLAAIRRLVTLYPFIDPARVGVWGWSYGGFTTTMMMARDEQGALACGAAVAPVSSWLYYDSMYTERYMDTPRANPAGYRAAELLSLAEALRGRRFLLVHGSGDDNVHHQHSLQLAKQLQHADIAFEQVTYTDENHSLRGVSRHFYHTLDHFWTKCFYP